MNYDLLINLIIIINIVLTFSANLPLAGQTFRKKLQPVLTKPKSYLQNVPKYISSLIFLLIIAGLFGLGKIEIKDELIQVIRTIFAGLYVLFSWLQILAAKNLGEFYTQDIVIYKDHKLIDKGFYKIIRHPVYLTQILQDLFAGLALANYLIIPLTLFIEFPLYVLRTNFEEKILTKNLAEYKEYANRTGKWFPKVRILKTQI